MSYFDYYKTVNDLSEAGRQEYHSSYDHLYGRFLPSDKTSKILDIGCGCGLLLEWLNKRGYKNISGIDIDERQIIFARDLGLNANYIPDATKIVEILKSQEKCYKLLIMTDVLEHIENCLVNPLLEACRRALIINGNLLICVPNANSSFAGRYRYIDITHQRSYIELSIEHTLSMAGFDEIKVFPVPIWLVRSWKSILRSMLMAFFRLWRRLEAMAELGLEGVKIPLSLNIIVLAHKRRDL